MNTTRKEKVNVKIDLNDYLNTSTGNPLLQDVIDNKQSINIRQEGKYVIIESDNYCVLDSDVVKYLGRILKKAELASVYLISQDLKTPLNIVYNNNVPHTNETLQEMLGYNSEAMFIKLVRSLMKAGVLYQIKGRIMGEVRVIYMLNPFVARKRKSVDEKVIEIFEEYKDYKTNLKKIE